MKRQLLGLCLIAATFLFSVEVGAQIKTPSASPKATVMQQVGLIDITVEYSRPGVKGRTIFANDGLVPYNKLWRTGANAVTKFTCSGKVMIGGQELKKGSYAMLSKPSNAMWEVYFYPYESSRWSSYKEKSPVATVQVRPSNNNRPVETMMFYFAEVKDGSARLVMDWDKVNLALDITVNTDEEVMSNIERVLNGPSKGDYYNAANYFFNNGKDMKTAYEYVKKATDGDDQKFWQMRRRSQIEAALGMHKEAIATAKVAMNLAEKAGNMEYVKFNKDAIAKWSKMRM